MSRKRLYLLLAVLGAIVPYFHFLPWLLDHGFNMTLFFNQLRANRVSEFFAADVVVSAVVVLASLFFERRHVRALWWIPVLALVMFGVSVALPLLLYLREAPRKQPV